ncbi:MAG: competence/damage-inducible protein A [Oscillospiraceae bacterium]
MRAEIINVGTEIIIGDIVNTNGQYISQKLANIGIDVHYHTSVGDNKNRLQTVFSTAFNKSDVIVLTGGIGPTEDDLTKDAIFEKLALNSVINNEAYEVFKNYFIKKGQDVPSGCEKQYAFPEGAVIFPNDVGTASGCAIISGRKTVILLPGPPNEAELMLTKYVIPFLAKTANEVIVSRHIKIIKYKESEVEEALSDIMGNFNPTVAIYAKRSYVEVRITAKSVNKRRAEELISPLFSAVKNTFDSYIFNDDSLTFEEETIRFLEEKGKTLSICESCTGGLLSARLTSVSGASNVLSFAQTTYRNDQKQKYAFVNKSILDKNTEVSEIVAGQMATGTRFKSKSHIAVSITGVAGPNGGTDENPVGTVYISVCDNDNIVIKRFNFNELKRDEIREQAVINAMIMIKMFVLGNKIEDISRYKTKAFTKGTNQKLKSDSKNKYKTFISFFIVFILAILLWESGKFVYKNYISDNKQTLGIGGDVDFSSLPENYLKEFYYLYSENKDTKGYIKIDKTNIDFPVVQSKDNETYKNKNFDNKESKYGTTFFDYRNNIKQLDRNTVIYGNNFNDDIMFNDILKYKDIEFYKQNPTITMDTVYEKGDYQVFAAFMVNDNSEQGDIFEYDKLDFESDQKFLEFIQEVNKRSYINTSVDILPEDSIITLSTQDNTEFNDSKFILMAKRQDDEISIDLTVAKQNQSPLMPQWWYQIKQLNSDSSNTGDVDNLTVGGFPEDSKNDSSDLNNNENDNQSNNLENNGQNDNNSSGNGDNNTGTPVPPPVEPPVNDLNGTFTFTTYGYGHGVGLSQYGANEYAKAGQNHEQILRKYYAGIKIENNGLSTGNSLSVSTLLGNKTDTIAYITAGIAMAEVGEGFKDEALKAQLIAAHNFVKEANKRGVTPFAPWKDPSSRLINLAKSVENKVITYGGNIIYTPYFAMSSGTTQSAKDMWGNNQPWLLATDSSLDKNVSKPTYYMNYKNYYTISANDLKAKLDKTFSVNLSNNPKNWFKDIKKNNSGYVLSLNLDNKKTVKGRDIREKVFTTQSFKSHAFDVSYS